VGLCRYHRGEKLSAQRFIQHYAVDRIVELLPLLEPENQGTQDPFSLERRYEQHFPKIAQRLAQFVQGYDRSRESAQAILKFLEQHFEVNPAMKAKIAELIHLDKNPVRY
jgi:lincosamide nucleotidyltransferase B/F